MSNILVLRKIQVEHANTIAGLTYGFPAITQFLGYVHALSRKLETSHRLSLGACAVIVHQHQVHTYRPEKRGDWVFSLTRNPLTKKGETAPIVEEGRMHMTVSLVVECEGVPGGNDAAIKVLEAHIVQQCSCMRLAGGRIVGISRAEIYQHPQYSDEPGYATRRLMRSLLPGFVLLDRTEYLAEHWAELQEKRPEAEMLDAWLDFVALKYHAQYHGEGEPDLDTPAEWIYSPKPHSGYLVPISVGYKAISPIFSPGDVANTRDVTSPFCFVEAVYGVGEWQSPHRVESLDTTLWEYSYDAPYYVCRSRQQLARQYTDFSDPLDD